METLALVGVVEAAPARPDSKPATPVAGLSILVLLVLVALCWWAVIRFIRWCWRGSVEREARRQAEIERRKQELLRDMRRED